MAAIPKGYVLHVTNRQGIVIATLDLQGYDFSKPAAQADIAQEIQNEIERDQLLGGRT